MIVDWDKQFEVKNKYDAVVLLGGKGAKKSLWDDPIVPQILTDHYRFGSIIGALGSAIVVLVRASLVTGEVPVQGDANTIKELEFLNAVCVDTPVISRDNLVLGQGANSVSDFSKSIIDCIKAM